MVPSSDRRGQNYPTPDSVRISPVIADCTRESWWLMERTLCYFFPEE